MREPVVCPHCQSSLRVARENEGKRAKCPKCGQSFVLKFAVADTSLDNFDEYEDASPPPIPESRAAIVVTPKSTTKSTSTKRNRLKGVTLPPWAVMAVPAIVTLIVGYFIGREHVKYQMRSALAEVANVFSNGLTGRATPAAVSAPLQQLILGQTYKTETFAITLGGAKIEKPKVTKLMGDDATSADPALILSFTFANTDDRRILRFREGNQFMAGNFRLRDDVDNVIRGVNYGFSSKPVGALTGTEDIAPAETANHVEIFAVPPPKTEFLILTVDLACLGGEGEIEFKIPASSITK